MHRMLGQQRMRARCSGGSAPLTPPQRRRRDVPRVLGSVNGVSPPLTGKTPLTDPPTPSTGITPLTDPPTPLTGKTPLTGGNPANGRSHGPYNVIQVTTGTRA